VTNDKCVLYCIVPVIAHPLSLFFLVRLVVVVTLQSSLSRPSVLRSYNQSRSNRSSTTLKSGALSFTCTASLLDAHLWSSFRASSILAPQPSLNPPPLLGSPYRTPSVPSSATMRNRCVFVRCAASYLPVLILPTFRATSVALPLSLDHRFVPTSSIPTSSQFIINRSVKAPSTVYHCQIVAHTPSACFWPTLAGSANVPSQPSNWRARRSQCSSSSHCVRPWLMSLPGWRGTSKTSLTLHGPPPGFCQRNVSGLDTVEGQDRLSRGKPSVAIELPFMCTALSHLDTRWLYYALGALWCTAALRGHGRWCCCKVRVSFNQR